MVSNLPKLLAFCCLLSPVAAPSQPMNSNVQQAISFLKSACVTSGSSLDITASGGGALQLKSLHGTGVQGSITLTKKELEGFADAASVASAQQASEMRNCMKPYIDKILASLLTNGATVGPQSYNLTTDGYYFVTEEFDRVMTVFADADASGAAFTAAARDSKLSMAKVRHYAEIAQANRLGRIERTPYDAYKFTISREGVAYSLSKGLVK